MNKPIVALATPPLNSALAVIRSSGEGVFSIVDQLFSKPVSQTLSRTAYVGYLKDGDKTIDQVVLLAYPSPNSITGEDVVEICCHGSMLIVGEIIEAFLSRGARYATAGEFTARAFYSGKMDLIEAEAVNDLINATTKESKNLALLSLEGKTSKLVGPLKERIASLLALLEVNIDYPEYTDIEEANSAKIEEETSKIRIDLSALIAQGEQGKVIRQGVKTAIVGAPNAGKSSVLNALLEQEKAIVSPIPGTTRDVVEGDISINGVPFHLLDTAGIREAKDVIESIGVERSRKVIGEADLVILVVDGAKGLSPQDEDIIAQAKGKKLIVCHNKSDLINNKDSDKTYSCAIKGDVERLKGRLFDCLGIGESSFLTPSFGNERELGLLREIDGYLKQAQQEAKDGLSPDLISVSLQEAYNASRRLLGEEPTQDLSEEIFSRFCVGK